MFKDYLIAKMNLFLFLLFMTHICVGSIVKHAGNQGRSIRLNPYTMKYLQQMASQTNARPKQQTFNPYQRQPSQLVNRQIQGNAPKLSLQALPSNSKLSIQPLGVKPLLVKPVYGQTYLNQKPSGSSNMQPAGPSIAQGKYTFAQVKQANTNNGKNVNPILVALPNLGNLLYKYAKRQVETQKTPVYNQNLYHMFGRQTYGPMPVPTATAYTATSQQRQQQPTQQPQKTSVYTQQQQYSAGNSQYGNTMRTAIPRPQPQPQQKQPQITYRAPVQVSQQARPSYGVQMPANTGYQAQGMSARSGYNAQTSSGGIKYVSLPAPQASPTQMSYSDATGDIHIGGSYGDLMHGSDWGGMLYISGPVDEVVNVMPKQPSMSTGVQSPTLTRYSPDVVQLNGDTSSFSGSIGKSIGAGTTCGGIPGAFCRDRKPGHYTNPGSRHCFIQCDAFGRGYNKECAPGTFWNVKGPEPALYNMCS